MKLFIAVLLLLISSTFAETFMADKGKLLFHDDMTQERGNKKTAVLSKDWKSKANMGIWQKVDDFYQASWKPGLGHTPVMGFGGKYKNVIIEVKIRFNEIKEKWQNQSFRIALDNRQLYTGHVLSAWVNPNNNFIERGFLLQHISRTKEKKIIDDILFDKQSLAYEVGKWHTVVLEVVDNQVLFHMEGNLAYAQSEKLNVEKKSFSLSFGSGVHDVKSVRVWEASLKKDWLKNKSKVLIKREEFTPQKHNYKRSK